MDRSDSIGVVADDFTGAMDTGVKFTNVGLETVLLLRDRCGQVGQVQVISTNTRQADAATARQRVRQAARHLPTRHLFKKIDSTMRGHIGVEAEALLEVTGKTKAVVCAAVIEVGYRILDGCLWLNGVWLHESDFAADPFWPTTTSKVAQLVGVPTTHLSLDTVKAGTAALHEAIVNAPTAVVTMDASDQADIDTISEAVVRGDFLPVGARGLAEAWIRKLTSGRHLYAPVAFEPEGPLLFVIGSHHPMSTAQADDLVAQCGLTMVEVGVETPESLDEKIRIITDSFSKDRSLVVRMPRQAIRSAVQLQAIASSLQALVLRVCQEAGPGGLVIIGGETAHAICQVLQTECVHIRGEFETAIPWGTLVGGIAAGRFIVTKGGGAGDVHSLTRLLDACRDGK